MFNDVIGFTLDSLYIDFANPFFLFGCATASYGLLVPYLCVCVCVCVSLSRVLTLCDPMVCAWTLQARILEWVAFPFSRESS